MIDLHNMHYTFIWRSSGELSVDGDGSSKRLDFFGRVLINQCKKKVLIQQKRGNVRCHFVV